MTNLETRVPTMEIRTAPPMVTAAVVAKVMMLSEPGVYLAARENRLPFPSFRIGRAVRFRRVDIEAFTGCPLEIEA